jgi:hypothetical protein
VKFSQARLAPATDEYFEQRPLKPFLQRVGYDCRVTVKTEESI